VLGLVLGVNAAEGVFNYKQNGYDWGQSYELCDKGREQSPIDLKGGFPSWKVDVELSKRYKDYFDASITEETGATVKVNFKDGGMKLTFDSGSKADFVPLQFHVHAPSEHSVDG